jgi:hypothetical protein
VLRPSDFARKKELVFTGGVHQIIQTNGPYYIVIVYKVINKWWFGTFFIFPYIGNSIFQRGRYTTNQYTLLLKPMVLGIPILGNLHINPSLRWWLNMLKTIALRAKILFLAGSHF